MQFKDDARNRRHADTLKRLGLDPIAKQADAPDEAENAPSELPKFAGPRPIGQQPDATMAIHRDPTPWQQKIRPLGRHVPAEAEPPSQELVRLGHTAEVNGVTEAGLDNIREVRPPSFDSADANPDNIREVRPPGAIDPDKPAIEDDSFILGQDVGGQVAGATATEVADAMKRKAGEYEQQYPLDDRRKAEEALAGSITNWGQLDANTRDLLTHLAVDVGVDQVLANDSLIEGINTDNHTAMADALQRFDGRTTQDKLDSYTAGLNALAKPDDQETESDDGLTLSLQKLLKEHEGQEELGYLDHLSHPTIGHGHKFIWKAPGDHNLLAVTGRPPSYYFDKENRRPTSKKLTPDQMQELLEL